MAQVSWDGFLKNTTQNYVTRTPEQFDAGKYSGEEPRGFFGSILDNIAGGVEGTVGSAADALGTVLKSEYAKGNASYPTAVVGKWLVDRGIDLNALAAENARRSGTLETYANMGLVDRLTTPSYWYDRRGLLSDASNAVGSMIPFMAMSAAMPEFGAGTVAGLIGGGLSRFGAKKAAELFKSGGAGAEFLAEGFKWAPTGVVDALANAGEIVAEMRENGHSDKEIADAIQVSMGYELPYDVALQIAQGGLLGGRAVKALTKNGGTGRSIAVNAGAGAAEAGTEGYQELIQTQATEKALGKPTGTFMNPTDEERGAFAAGVIGPLPLMAGRGALNMVQNRFRSGAGQSERIAGTSPAASTDGDDGGAEDADAPVRVGSLADDAAPFIGVTMDNGSQGCVEAVTKVGAQSCPFLAQELDNGVVNVDDLVAHAGNNVIPFDPDSLEEGDVIVYGDGSDPHLHVVLYDGKGGYIGNSTEQNKVVQGTDYTAMGTSENGEALVPTKIIKTGAQFADTHAAPLMPDFAGLVAGEEDLAQVQERIQKLIDTDGLTPAQHAAILEAAQRIRDMPVGDGTDAAADAEHVNEWQRLIDRKDIKGIFEKDPQKVVQTMAKLGKEQKAQKTRAAIENQQQIDEATQAIHALTAQSVTQPAQTGRVDNTVQGLPGMGETTASVGVNDLVGGYDTAQGGLLTNAPLPPAGGGGQSPQNIQGGAVGTAAENIPVQNSPAHIVGQGTGGGLLTPGLQAYETAQTGGANPLMNVPPAPAQTTAVRPDTAGQGAGYANAAGIPVQNETAMPMQSTAGVIRPTRRPSPVVGVRPNVPQTLPASLAERQALGRSLGRFMTDNHIHIPQQLGYDLMEGNGAAIAAANDKISAWEEKRAAQERPAKKGDVNPRQTAQEDAQSTRNTPHDTTYTQKETGAENASKSVRAKSAQKQAENELPSGYRTESGRPLSEADPQEFIIKPNGSKNFGEITKAVSDAVMEQSGEKLPIGEIRLRVGNSSEGLIHAKAHEKQAQDAGYDSVEDMIADIAENFDRIYMRPPAKEGQKPTYSLVKSGNKSKGIMNGVAPIYFELQTDGSGNYYIVITTIAKGDKPLAQQTKKDRLIYSSPGLGAATESNAGAVSASAKKVGADTRGGTPASDKSGDSSTSTISSEAEESKENELNEDEREAVKGLSADAKKRLSDGARQAQELREQAGRSFLLCGGSPP